MKEIEKYIWPRVFACFLLMLVLWKAFGIESAGNIFSFMISLYIAVLGIATPLLLLLPDKAIKDLDLTDQKISQKKSFQDEKLYVVATIFVLILFELYSTGITLGALSFAFYYVYDFRKRSIYPKPD